MQAPALWALALGAAMMFASPVPAAAPAEVQGKPRIIDGATLEVAGRRFRLAGIAAPALAQVCHRADQEYACGKVPRAVLWNLIAGREVTCQPVADTGSGDAGAKKTGARAATCRAGDTNLNESMVTAGWAVADPAGTTPYDPLEESAKAARRGLWSGEFDKPQALHETTE
jgi:endonuclease YncB( thermonuclease family)